MTSVATVSPQPKQRDSQTSLRVAMLAPPWIPVPPPGYGGIAAGYAAVYRDSAGIGRVPDPFGRNRKAQARFAASSMTSQGD